MTKQDALEDRAEAKAENHTYRTRPVPRTTLVMVDGNMDERRAVAKSGEKK